MREIEFRVWYYKEKRMIEWGEMKDETETIDIYLEKKCSDLSESMQYANLTDKNKKKIFDKDICKGNGGAEDFYFEIGFEDGCFICKMPWNARPELKYYIDMDFVSIEVVGNIYENPDLLKCE